MTQIKVHSINISEKKGVVKKPVCVAEINNAGVSGDAHSGNWHRQVSMLGVESLNKFEAQASRKVAFGEFAENITTEGMNLWETNPLDRFICGDVELEVTQIGKECHGSSCAIFKEVGDCVMPKEGIFTRVLHPGTLKAGDVLEYQPKVFKIWVITLSDRAFNQEYEDRSGPKILEMTEEFFRNNKRDFSTEYFLMPDDPVQLQELLSRANKESVDILFTTGGTGIGPRDFTPDVVKPLLDKEIPGMMEMIRMKYGMMKPAALISRSVAGVMGKTLVFTLPGSLKAVNEYILEINLSLMHLIYMLHALDLH